jgi:hypothetical protein
MKKSLFIFSLVTLLYSSAVPTYAIGCPQCSTFVQQFIDYARQGLQYSKDSISAYTNSITAAQQTLITVNDTVIKPAKTAMTYVSIIKNTDNVENLIKGSIGTSEGLLEKFPEVYIANKELNAIKAGIGDIAAQKSLYGDSVLSAIVDQTRYDYADVSTKLRTVNSSRLPSIAQNAACDETTLSNLAKEDIEISGQPLDQAAYSARKQYFYEKLCVKDPNKDEATAQALQTLTDARPEIGGWDSWLELTNGSNAWNNLERSKTILATRATEVAEAARNDLNLGGGIRSLTACTGRAQADINGDPYSTANQAPCISEEIKQVSSALSTAFNETIVAPFKTQYASLGTGTIMDAAFSTLDLMRGISSSISSIKGSVNELGGTDGGNGGGTVNNIPITTTVAKVYDKDLLNNPTKKKDIERSPDTQLKAHSDALITLERLNQDFLSTITYHQGQLDTMKSCYDKLVNDYQISSDARVSSAYKYYGGETCGYGQGQNCTGGQVAVNNNLRAQIQAEQAVAATTKTFVQETGTKIDDSQSTDEVLTLFTNYLDRVENEGMPNTITVANRDGAYIGFKGSVDQSVMQGGAIFNYKETCVAIDREIQEALMRANAGA